MRLRILSIVLAMALTATGERRGCAVAAAPVAATLAHRHLSPAPILPRLFSCRPGSGVFRHPPRLDTLLPGAEGPGKVRQVSSLPVCCLLPLPSLPNGGRLAEWQAHLQPQELDGKRRLLRRHLRALHKGHGACPTSTLPRARWTVFQSCGAAGHPISLPCSRPTFPRGPWALHTGASSTADPTSSGGSPASVT